MNKVGIQVNISLRILFYVLFDGLFSLVHDNFVMICVNKILECEKGKEYY